MRIYNLDRLASAVLACVFITMIGIGVAGLFWVGGQ